MPPERNTPSGTSLTRRRVDRAIQQRAQFLGQRGSCVVRRVLVGLDGEAPVAPFAHAEAVEVVASDSSRRAACACLR